MNSTFSAFVVNFFLNYSQYLRHSFGEMLKWERFSEIFLKSTIFSSTVNSPTWSINSLIISRVKESFCFSIYFFSNVLTELRLVPPRDVWASGCYSPIISWFCFIKFYSVFLPLYLWYCFLTSLSIVVAFLAASVWYFGLFILKNLFGAY